MQDMSIKLLYDILEDLIAKWGTRYKLSVAREQSWSPLTTEQPLILHVVPEPTCESDGA